MIFSILFPKFKTKHDVGRRGSRLTYLFGFIIRSIMNFGLIFLTWEECEGIRTLPTLAIIGQDLEVVPDEVTFPQALHGDVWS